MIEADQLNFLHVSILDLQFPPNVVGIERNGNARLPSRKVGVLDAPTVRTRGELMAS